MMAFRRAGAEERQTAKAASTAPQTATRRAEAAALRQRRRDQELRRRRQDADSASESETDSTSESTTSESDADSTSVSTSVSELHTEPFTFTDSLGNMVRTGVGIPLGLAAGVIGGGAMAIRDVFQGEGVGGRVKTVTSGGMQHGVGAVLGFGCGVARGTGRMAADVYSGTGVAGTARVTTEAATNVATGLTVGVTLGAAQGAYGGAFGDSSARDGARSLVCGAAEVAAGTAVGIGSGLISVPSACASTYRRQRERWFSEEQRQRLRAVEGAIENLQRRQEELGQRAEQFLKQALAHKAKGKLVLARQVFCLHKLASEQACQLAGQCFNLQGSLLAMERSEIDHKVATAMATATGFLAAANKQLQDLNPEAIYADLSETITVSKELGNVLAQSLDGVSDQELEAELAELAGAGPPVAAAAPQLVAPQPAAAQAAPAAAPVAEARTPQLAFA